MSPYHGPGEGDEEESAGEQEEAAQTEEEQLWSQREEELEAQGGYTGDEET